MRNYVIPLCVCAVILALSSVLVYLAFTHPPDFIFTPDLNLPRSANE